MQTPVTTVLLLYPAWFEKFILRIVTVYRFFFAAVLISLFSVTIKTRS